MLQHFHNLIHYGILAFQYQHLLYSVFPSEGFRPDQKMIEQHGFFWYVHCSFSEAAMFAFLLQVTGKPYQNFKCSLCTPFLLTDLHITAVPPVCFESTVHLQQEVSCCPMAVAQIFTVDGGEKGCSPKQTLKRSGKSHCFAPFAHSFVFPRHTVITFYLVRNYIHSPSPSAPHSWTV